jgi:hypothetical protein
VVLVRKDVVGDLVEGTRVPLGRLVAVALMVELEILSVELEVGVRFLRLASVQKFVKDAKLGSLKFLHLALHVAAALLLLLYQLVLLQRLMPFLLSQTPLFLLFLLIRLTPLDLRHLFVEDGRRFNLPAAKADLAKHAI